MVGKNKTKPMNQGEPDPEEREFRKRVGEIIDRERSILDRLDD